MEALVLARDHWATEKPPGWSQLKFDHRQRLYDVITIKPSGYYRVETLGEGTHGWNRDAFFLVRVPWISYDDAKAYQGKAEVDGAMALKFKYQIEPLDVFSNSEVTINGKTFTERWLDINTRQQLRKIRMKNKVTDSAVEL